MKNRFLMRLPNLNGVKSIVIRGPPPTHRRLGWSPASTAAERRKTVAHGVSHGFNTIAIPPPRQGRQNSPRSMAPSAITDFLPHVLLISPTPSSAPATAPPPPAARSPDPSLRRDPSPDQTTSP